MDIDTLALRIAYFALFITLLLMTWAFSVESASSGHSSTFSTKNNHGNPLDEYPSCSFNPLCTCSSPGPSDFGIVSCHSVPFGNIPSSFNNSRAFLVSLADNQLGYLQGKRLMGTGLWRLEIRNNNLHEISNEAFAGLEYTMWELDLSHNELTSIPSVSLQRLEKLRFLDLSSNHITDISSEDVVAETLTCLILSDNMIASIPEDAFTRLRSLERLDLSKNSIQMMHSNALIPVSGSLTYLSLASNLIQRIPYESLGVLNNLEYLYLTDNLISITLDGSTELPVSVSNLYLDHNDIEILDGSFFQNFKSVSTLDISFNPILYVGSEAFISKNPIESLYLSNCLIHSIHDDALSPLSSYLIRLDLSYNNLSSLDPMTFSKASELKYLVLDGNKITDQNLQDLINESSLLQNTLEHVSIMGDQGEMISTSKLTLLQNLRTLNLSALDTTALSKELFRDFGAGVEELRITHGKLGSIKSHAFQFLPSLKIIDFHDNDIQRIADDAFADVAHSLIDLRMNGALKDGMSLPPGLLKSLKSLKYLDMSDNGMSSLEDDPFPQASHLLILNLRYNKLTDISAQMFKNIHHLKKLGMSFNSLKSIRSGTFKRLSDLEHIELNENLIENIETRAFQDLTSLRVLNLAGNKIKILESESFQNIPHLRHLDLSNNRISTFAYDIFDQLGTLSSFSIDFSHNEVNELGETASVDRVTFMHGISSSIEALDLSHNNISYIEPYFFAPTWNNIRKLDLSYNSLTQIKSTHLHGLKFLQVLSLQHNQIKEISPLDEISGLQVLDIGNNDLEDIMNIFTPSDKLRFLSAKSNKIRNIGDTVFRNVPLEFLDLEFNDLVRLPDTVLSHVSETLTHLNLGHNQIAAINENQMECLESLQWLDISDNRISSVANGSFNMLKTLYYLDFGGNPLAEELNPALFKELRHVVKHLHMSNISIEALPELPTFDQLLTFNCSHNKLTFLPTNLGVNVSNLRTLDMSKNEIPQPPSTVWYSIPRLINLKMGRNPIKSLTNESFLQLERLMELDFSQLPLEELEMGLLNPFPSLKKASMGPLNVDSVRLSDIIRNSKSLQHADIKLDEPSLDNQLRNDQFSRKLSEITLSGEKLTTISMNAFKDIKPNMEYSLAIMDSGIKNIPGQAIYDLGSNGDLTLILKGNNSRLEYVGNPYKRTRSSVAIKNIEIDPNTLLKCTCDSGWLEFWMRDWLEKNCPLTSELTKATFNKCNHFLRSLRRIQCKGKNQDETLLSNFAHKLECNWKSASSSKYQVNLVSLNLLRSIVAILMYMTICPH